MKTHLFTRAMQHGKLWGFLFLVLSIPSPAAAQKVLLVTATDYCKTITREEMLKLYKGEANRGPDALLFLDHQVSTKVYQDFIRQYFNNSPAEMQKYWQEAKLKTGKLPPKFLPEAFLPKALKSMKGSISYYYEGQVPEGLLVIPL